MKGPTEWGHGVFNRTPEHIAALRELERAIKHRPRIRLTIRQRMRVVDKWPRHETLL